MFHHHHPMIMKAKTLFRMLPCALLLAGGLYLTSCSDDDDVSGAANQELTDVDSDTADKLSRMLVALSPSSELGKGWAQQTYEVVEGEPVDGNHAVRMIAVSGEEEARSFYQSLTGYLLKQGTTSDTWHCDGLGDLTYTWKGQSDCYATVDISIKQLPGITQMRLVPAAMLADNAGGRVYYSYGDVLFNSNDGTYWICCRPAAPQYGKKKSHWACLKVSDDHIREVTLKNASGYINAPYKLRTTMALAKAFGQMLTLIKCANLYDFQGQDALGGTETPSGPQLARTHAEWFTENYAKVCQELHGEGEDGEDPGYFLPLAAMALDYEKHAGFSEKDYDWLTRYFMIFYDSYSKYNGDTVGMPAAYFNKDKLFDFRADGVYLVKHDLDTSSECVFDIQNYINFHSRGDIKVGNEMLAPKGLVPIIKTGYEISAKKIGNPSVTEKLPGDYLKEVYVYTQKYQD